MLAALELVCPTTTTVDQVGLTISGARGSKSLCEQWQIEPIPNLLGNKMRRYYVSDNTRELARFAAGAIEASEIADRVASNAFELYRFGVLQTSIKANNAYSEACELRVLVVDLRYDETDNCILSKVEVGDDPAACLASSDGFETEKSYELADVFDGGLAARSLTANRSKALADELRVLERRYRRTHLRIAVRDALRICLTAAASRVHMNDWREFVGDWLTELAFEDLQDDEATLFHSHLSSETAGLEHHLLVV